MSSENPFQSPAPEEEIVVPAGATLRIKPFEIPPAGFKCTVLSSEEVLIQLNAKLVEYLQELGFLVTKGDADYTLEGSLLVVQQGNRLLRYLAGGLLGHAKVEAAGEVYGGPDEARSYSVKARRIAGLFGGESKELLTQCISEVGFKISTEAGLIGKRIDPKESASAWAYLRVLFAIAAIVGAVLGVGRYGFGTVGVAMTGDVIADEVRFAIFTALAGFGMITLLGLALAPQWVLLSRSLHKLRTSAGIKSIWGIRLLLATFSIFAALLAALMSIEHIW